jgi:hypothetical protein
MQKSEIKDQLRRTGCSYTDLDNGVRVSALGPQSPGSEGKTEVRVSREGEELHLSQHPTHGTAAKQYVDLIEEYR